jgi:hypothetical protein
MHFSRIARHICKYMHIHMHMYVLFDGNTYLHTRSFFSSAVPRSRSQLEPGPEVRLSSELGPEVADLFVLLKTTDLESCEEPRGVAEC